MSQGHVDAFAREGLRTLAFGKKELSEEDALTFKHQIEAAEQDLENTEEKMQQIFKEIEENLELLGVTAIEDRLQEGVSETIKVKIVCLKIKQRKLNSEPT